MVAYPASSAAPAGPADPGDFADTAQRHRRAGVGRRQVSVVAAAAAVAATGALLGAPASAQTAPVPAEVTKIDKAAGRVTLKHGEVKALNMPPMTMAYKVREPRLLDDLAIGDRVRFVPERIDGQYTATALSKAP